MKPNIGINMGDPLGVGPEIIAKILDNPPKDCNLKIIGDQKILKAAQDLVAGGTTHKPKITAQKAALLTLQSLQEGIALATTGKIDALITAPINKSRMRLILPSFIGSTEYLAEQTNSKNVTMLFATTLPNDKVLVTALVTRHIPIREVPSNISIEKILAACRSANLFSRLYLGINKPVIGVLSLNPHAGENTTPEVEEHKIITPAIAKAKKLGLNVKGPISPDTAFACLDKFDAIVAQYHDQGIAPIKTLSFDKTVNISMGLPFLRTSVAHGTADDIAWKGIARATNLLETIKFTTIITKRYRRIT